MVKPIDDFYKLRRKRSTLIHSYCKRCAIDARTEAKRVKAGVRNRRREAARAEAIKQPDKVCKGCEKRLPKGDFYKQADMFDGYTLYCKQCSNDRGRVARFMKRAAKARTEGSRPGRDKTTVFNPRLG